MTTTAQPLARPASVWRVHLGGVLGALLLLVLIAIPPLLYFDDQVLARAGGLAIEVRFILLLVVCAVAALVVLLSDATHIPHLLLPFALFVALGLVVAVLRGLPVRWWFPPVARWAACILVAWAAYNLVRGGFLSHGRLRAALIAGLIGPMLFGAAQALFGLVPLLNGAFRIYGPFVGSPLNFALFLSGLCLLLLGTTRLTWLDYAMIAAAGVLLLFSHSRLVIVGYAACLGLLMLLQRRFALVIGVGLCAAALLLTSSSLTEQLLGRFRSIQTINGEVLQRAPHYAFQYEWTERNVDNSVLLRVQTHFVGWEAFQRAPLLGHGLGSFVPIYEARTGRADVAAHNDYLLYLVETGLIGVTLYLGLQIWLIWSLLLPPRWCSPMTRALCRGAAAAYICVNVLSFLSNSYYFYEVQTWIWLGIGVALGFRRLDRDRAVAAEARRAV